MKWKGFCRWSGKASLRRWYWSWDLTEQVCRALEFMLTEQVRLPVGGQEKASKAQWTYSFRSILWGRSERSGRALGQHVEEGPPGPGRDGPTEEQARGKRQDLGGCRKPWWPWQLARAGPAPAGGPHWDLGPWLLNCWGYFRCYFYFLMFLVCSENQRSEFYVTCHTV